VRESEIQEKVTAYAIRIGLISIRINVVGRKGWPDYGYGYNGRMCFVEFKRLGEKPDGLQAYVHKQLRSYGFYVFVIDNVDEGIAKINEWKRWMDNEDN
jgi:hypothetical protein